MDHKKSIRERARLQSDLAIQTEVLNRRLERNKKNREFEENERNGTKPTPRSPLNILDQLDFDGDKLLNTLTLLFDQYKENKNKELLKQILNEITVLNDKINIKPKPQTEHIFGTLLSKLNKIDIEKTVNTLSLISQLHKVIMNKTEDTDEDKNEEENNEIEKES